MGLNTDRHRRVAMAILLCALGLLGAPAHAATLAFDGASGDIPIHSAKPAGGWTLFSTDRNFLAAGASLPADAMLASVYSGTGGMVPHWSGAPRAGGDEVRSLFAAKAPVSLPAVQAMFYLLLAALMLSAAVGHVRSRRANAR
jgi:hypothetical protein